MANFIYLPVPSEEMCSLAAKAKDALGVPTTNIQANKHIAGPAKSMYRWIEKCLSKVTANDRVYILLHGTGKPDSVHVAARRSTTLNKQVKVQQAGLTTWEGGKLKQYTPQHLAATLIKEGLPKSTTDIHVLTCGSGLAGEKDPWAKRFKDELSKHCNNLTVTGYLGEISINVGKVQIESDCQFYSLEDKAVRF